jgi:hypothetical protein
MALAHGGTRPQGLAHAVPPGVAVDVRAQGQRRQGIIDALSRSVVDPQAGWSS